MDRRTLDPRHIQGVNYPYPDKVARLAESLRANGWPDRPLLVEELEHAPYGYATWTGSHRLEAARRLGLTGVPCVVMTIEDCRAFERAGYDKDGYQSWREAVTGMEGQADRHRVQRLTKAGLAEAARMLQEEIDSEEW